MPDSTPTPPPRRRLIARAPRVARRALTVAGRVLLVTVCAAVLATGGAPAAWADGDPASDVLASQPLFLPSDGGFTPGEQIQLNHLLESAARAGAPIRVALVARPADLGSIGALWGNPRGYARFLSEELSDVYRGTLLVVMPSGFGVARVGAGPGASPSAAEVPAPPAPPAGTPMVAAAVAAVRTLAAGAGHPLASPGATAAGTAQAAPSALGSVDAGSWLALAAGAGVIVLAWGASLRARPLRRPPRALNE